jgi:hypothetical protein
MVLGGAWRDDIFGLLAGLGDLKRRRRRGRIVVYVSWDY